MIVPPAIARQFDAAVERVLADLPPALHDLLEEVPLVVEDVPDRRLMEEMEIEHPEELCGLHEGLALTERSVDDLPMLPDTITIYRAGILAISTDEHGRLDPEEMHEQIRITILHEIGHHFGLDEDDLEAVGYD